MSAEDIKVIQSGSKFFEAIQRGQCDGMDELFIPFLGIMGRDIGKQRQRLGGDWAIAQAVMNRLQRDAMRKELGPDLVFIVLNMNQACQKKRVGARHGEGAFGETMQEALSKMYQLYHPADEDEPNAVNVEITEDMSREDVLEKVLDIISKM